MNGPAPTTHPTILLADSDAQSREVFGRFFQRSGWRFDTVTDSSDVVGALDNRDYDIIIADVAMPGADGQALLAQILLRRPSQAIIAVSSDTSSDEALKCFRSGATDILARPIDCKWLERVVKRVARDRQHDQRERRIYRYVTSERTSMRFSCRQLAELGTISLPIVERLRAARLIDHGSALRIKLAIQEAIVNGMEHGNLELKSEWKEEILADGRDRFSVVRRERLLDPDFANRTVTLCSWFDGNRLEITVTDQGQGFLSGNPGMTRTPVSGIACSGRGLAMMESAVDQVLYGRNGSEVTLMKLVKWNGD